MSYLERELLRALRLWRAQERQLSGTEDTPEDAETETARDGSLPRRPSGGADGYEPVSPQETQTGAEGYLPAAEAPAAPSGEREAWPETGEISAAGEAETLSDRLERDARRYDSAFIRYQ